MSTVPVAPLLLLLLTERPLGAVREAPVPVPSVLPVEATPSQVLTEQAGRGTELGGGRGGVGEGEREGVSTGLEVGVGVGVPVGEAPVLGLGLGLGGLLQQPCLQGWP